MGNCTSREEPDLGLTLGKALCWMSGGGSGGLAGSGPEALQLALGQEVVLGGKYPATVRYHGETQFASGQWVGVELQEARGKNDGSVHGIRYFTCKPKWGLFVREHVVTPQGNSSASLVGDTSTALAEIDATLAEVDACGGAEDAPPEGEVLASRKSRRYAVSAETASQSPGTWAPPVYPKSAEERQELRDIIRTSHDSRIRVFFGNLSPQTIEQIIDAMFPRPVAEGDSVILQGDVGDYFYIVKKGQFDILKPTQGNKDCLVKVFEASEGYAFGELALLYNAPRSATITASRPSEVWCLERLAFRELVVRSSEEQFKKYTDFLRRCEIFHELSGEQIASLAEVAQEEDFDVDEAILEQGDKDNNMYIVCRGQAVACINGDQGEVEVMHYREGDYFGEIALLQGEPRQASVYSVGQATCIYLSRQTFSRLLGPLRNFLNGNIEKYQKYQDAIRQVAEGEHVCHSESDGAPTPCARTPSGSSRPGTASMRTRNKSEVFEGAILQSISKLDRRKRNRLSLITSVNVNEGDEEEEAAAAEAPAEGAEAAAPSSLGEKVAQDFKDASLVEPCAAFSVSDTDIRVFGGMRPGEKFTNDKVVVASCKVAPSIEGLDDSYSWVGRSWLQGATHVAALCQKGQKSASDPTPNQDNYFVVHRGSVGAYGVADGHGPFGHLVSFRIVQTLPHFLFSNEHAGQDWELALRESFLAAQEDLVAFSAEHNVNIEASGAAATVIVADLPAIHVAHIGDSSAIVASWSRRDSRLIHSTRDHKPNLPEEKARLEAAGSEVREVDEDNYRIYLPGKNFPGLTMSRSFGDMACEGVLREPEYTRIFMQPMDELYAIVASDGIWEFIPTESAVDLTAKKLRLKGPRETVRFLTDASRKRWQHVCGEYCDDITAVLVQWNVKEKSSDVNHSFTVRRHE